MRVKLKDINPNPYRDFAVDPVDNDRVDMLVTSMGDSDFWGGIPCRKLPSGEIQNAAGEHRKLAAIKFGITHADLVVGKYTDDQMISIYALENATQRGNNPLTIAGSIAGALRKCLEEQFCARDFTSAKSPKARDQGIGEGAILAKLKEVPGIGPNVIKQQLANLKASGHYDRIEREVTELAETAHTAELARIAAEEEAARQAEAAAVEAEQRRQAAEEQRKTAEAERKRLAAETKATREAKAREEAQRREAEAEERRKAAEERARAAAAEAKEQRETAKTERRKADTSAAAGAATKAKITATKAKPRVVPVFDMTGVGRYFKTASHLEAFRTIIVGDGDGKGRDAFVPVEKQAEVAAALIELYNEKRDSGALKHMHPPELTAALVKELTKEVLASDRMLAHLLSEAEKRQRREELARSAWSDRWNAACHDLARMGKATLTAVQKLESLSKERPDGIDMAKSVDFSSAQSQLNSAVRILNKFTAPVTIEIASRRA